ncbi:MAG: PTS sugar transporter subunit IIA [Candidatus Omnitrophica bacterium]|nr:PTS sugar transporter subunit IIA [Candidatus Omnitrophota bacterium]MDD5488896.1 PTS sugar transporter subunit IIA [Candidatus Omnitrophota bacterium]
MQLSVKDLSKLLNVTERTIYRWIKQQSIPFYRIHDQYRFNRVEILDWATSQKMDLSQAILDDGGKDVIDCFSLADTIKKGGIYYRVEGNDKKTLLSAVIDLLNLPDDVKKENLLNAMLVREELGSTGLGDGIAIPHARYPVVTHIPQAIVSICFLERPVDYGAIDGKPVSCLFTLISPTVRSHLKMLSRTAFVLKNADVKKAIVAQMSREVILSEIEKAERLLGT